MVARLYSEGMKARGLIDGTLFDVVHSHGELRFRSDTWKGGISYVAANLWAFMPA